MNKEYLENKLAEGFSTNQIAKELKITGAGVRYHMKKWNLHSQHLSIQDKACYRTNTHKECPRCKEIKTLDKFDRRSNGNIQSYCRVCINVNRYSLIKQHKITLIQEFGGKCIKCNYNKNISALEFHHLDPKTKDFHFSSTKTTNIDKIRKELDKCILVCANCHREVHYPYNNLEDL